MDAGAANDVAKVMVLFNSGYEIPELWLCDHAPLFFAAVHNNVELAAYLMAQGHPPFDHAYGAQKLHPDSDPHQFTLAGVWAKERHAATLYLLTHGAPANSSGCNNTKNSSTSKAPWIVSLSSCWPGAHKATGNCWAKAEPSPAAACHYLGQ